MFSKPTRNHITIILEQIGAVGIILITGSFSALFDIIAEIRNGLSISALLKRAAIGETEVLVFVAVALLGVLAVVWMLLRWYKTVFFIAGEYLVVEKNTLMRRTSRLPLGSVSTVNLERNVFERIVGTAKIKLDINSAATANQTDFTFVLPLEKAKAFEKELMSKKTNEEKEDNSLREKQLVCAFTARQALRDVLLGQPIIQILVFIALLALGIPVDEWFLSGAVSEQVLPALVLVLLSWGAGMVMQFMSAYGFKMEKDEKSFFISSGLLKKKQYSFDKDKVNALIIRRPFLARIFGLYRAEVAVVGLGNDKHETPQICLLVKKQELERILNECAPDFTCTGKIKKSHRAGLAASLCFYATAAVIVAVAASFVHFLLSLAVIAVGVIFGVMSYRGKTLSADDNVFSYSHGAFSRTYGYFKYSGIQTVQHRTNPLLRRLDLGKIRISILSSSTVSVHTTGWFGSEHFEALASRISC